MIDLEELKRLLSYDPETGKWTWKVYRSRLAREGDTAGTPHHKDRYIRLHVNGRMHTAHRLAWFYMTGGWPLGEIDHINGDREDNRWNNLREAPKQLNALNRKIYRTNTSGQKGIHWHPRLGKWRVRIQQFGRRISLGCYDTMEDAAAAYAAAEKVLYGPYSRGTSA